MMAAKIEEVERALTEEEIVEIVTNLRDGDPTNDRELWDVPDERHCFDRARQEDKTLCTDPCDYTSMYRACIPRRAWEQIHYLTANGPLARQALTILNKDHVSVAGNISNVAATMGLGAAASIRELVNSVPRTLEGGVGFLKWFLQQLDPFSAGAWSFATICIRYATTSTNWSEYVGNMQRGSPQVPFTIVDEETFDFENDYTSVAAQILAVYIAARVVAIAAGASNKVLGTLSKPVMEEMCRGIYASQRVNQLAVASTTMCVGLTATMVAQREQLTNMFPAALRFGGIGVIGASGYAFLSRVCDWLRQTEGLLARRGAPRWLRDSIYRMRVQTFQCRAAALREYRIEGGQRATLDLGAAVVELISDEMRSLARSELPRFLRSTFG